MKIYLCGFMGAGKTTFFKQLSFEAGDDFKCVDTDDELFKRFSQGHKDLGEMIGDLGWEKFRELEAQILEEIFNSPSSYLVSLGGGSLNPSNIGRFSSPENKLIYIETPIELCWDRVKNDSNRPLVAKGFQSFKELFESRRPLYESAQMRVSGSNAFPPLKDLL